MLIAIASKNTIVNFDPNILNQTLNQTSDEKRMIPGRARGEAGPAEPGQEGGGGRGLKICQILARNEILSNIGED